MISPGATRQVAIIGAGPAGATLAYELLQGGLNPLVIDAEEFPRTKVCAGGLTVKALRLLPAQATAVLENEIDRVQLSFGLRSVFTKSSPQPLLYTTDRLKLDAWLIEIFRAAGGDFRDGEPLEKITAAPGGAYALVTSRGEVRAEIVVGADGARSLVARGVGLRPVDFRHLGLQAEVPRDLVHRNSVEFIRTVWLDMGTIPDGYAWAFPRGDLLLIGVGGPAHQARQLKGYHARLLSCLGLSENRFPLAAHLIPHRVTHQSLVKDRVLLVGDAAGLADYWTGEGIFMALKSARLAARHILKFFQGDNEALAAYQSQVDLTITPESRTSYQFAKIFNYLGPLVFRCLKRYDYPWEVFCRAMRGDRSFWEIKKRFRPDIFLRKLLVKSARNRPIA